MILQSDYSSNLPQKKVMPETLKGLPKQLLICEFLKTFATPMDLFSFNRALMNETMKLAGGDLAAVVYFNDAADGVKYVQKSNGAFEKKQIRPPFYFVQKEAALIEIDRTGSEDGTDVMRHRWMLLVPMASSRYPLGAIEVYFSEKPAGRVMAETMKCMTVLSRCAVLAVINNVIRSESFEISKMSYTSPADVEKKLSENRIYLTRDTFAAYIDAIIELLAMSCPARYTAVLLWDRKNPAYRVVGENFFNETQNEGSAGIFREMSIKAIDAAVNKMQTITISGRKGFKAPGHPESEENRDLLAVPIINFNQGRGGIVIINPFEKKDATAGFGYDENMAVLLLANYLGAFYDNFLSTSTLENKIRSLSIIYTISSISDNFFDSMDFDSAINRALMEISLFMRVYCCALALYDDGDEELKTYSSLTEDISTPLSELISSLNMDFWKNNRPGGRAETENNSSIINLSQVSIFREQLHAFHEKLNKISGSETGFEINARPIHYNHKPIGYMFFINTATAADEGCQSLCRGNEAETIDFMIAASTILTSMIVAQKNYQTLARLEKYAARMERLASIGEVAAGVAHEIRNPLGGISLFATSLSGSFEDGDRRKNWISQIIEAVGRINGMVSNLLNFSRDEIINKKVVTVHQIVKEVLFFMQKEIAEKEALIEILPKSSANTGTFNIYCDPEKIKQVIANLISNSLNAFEKRTAGPAEVNKIKIIMSRDGERDFSSIYLCDNGPGIPAELSEKIFRPFFTTRSKGTGLGLSITQKIIEAHGGSINLASPGEKPETTDCKTVFEIKLPNENKV